MVFEPSGKSSVAATTSSVLHDQDRRKHKRVQVKIDSRFLAADGTEHTAELIDISCAGARLKAAGLPQVGSDIICYLGEIGRVAGNVTGSDETSFTVTFNISAHKRDKIADQLTWILNRDALGLKDDRAALRSPSGGPALVTLSDGRQIQCKTIDLSLTGAGFETDAPPPRVGDRVRVGTVSGEVVRAVGGRFAIRYSHLKD